MPPNRLYRAVELFWAVAVLEFAENKDDEQLLAGVLNQERFRDYWTRWNEKGSLPVPAATDRSVWGTLGYGITAHYQSCLAGWGIITTQRGSFPVVESSFFSEEDDQRILDSFVRKLKRWLRGETIGAKSLKNLKARPDIWPDEASSAFKRWKPWLDEAAARQNSPFFSALWLRLGERLSSSPQAFKAELERVRSEFKLPKGESLSEGELLRGWAKKFGRPEEGGWREMELIFQECRQVEFITRLADFLLAAMILSNASGSDFSTDEVVEQFSPWLTPLREMFLARLYSQSSPTASLQSLRQALQLDNLPKGATDDVNNKALLEAVLKRHWSSKGEEALIVRLPSGRLALAGKTGSQGDPRSNNAVARFKELFDKIHSNPEDVSGLDFDILKCTPIWRENTSLDWHWSKLARWIGLEKDNGRDERKGDDN